MGSRYKSRWLVNGMLHQFKSYQNSLLYPCGALAPWFCSVIHSAKLRLRKTQAFFSAQNDRLIDYFAVFYNNRKVKSVYSAKFTIRFPFRRA